MPSFAKESYSSKGKERATSGASGAGGNRILSMQDILGSLSNTFDGIIPDWQKDEGRDPSDEEPVPDTASRGHEAIERVALPPPESKQEQGAQKTTVKEPSSPDQPQMIKAKRLDEPNVDAQGRLKQEEAPAPYKVYSAPQIPDDPVEPEPPVVQRVAPARESMPPDAFDTKNPPPLSNASFFDSIRTKRRETVWEQNLKSGETPAPRVSDARPVSALPKQFFPVFAVGASDNAQAQLLPIASNIELESDHSQTSRAIIVIHDLQRDSAANVASLMTLSGMEGEPVLILAPHFSLDVDIMRFAKHLPDQGRTVSRWSMDDPWQYGGESVLPNRNKGISSFTAMDILLLFLSDRERFPYLQQVVIAGHGIGADFVQRYAAMGRATDILVQDDLPVRFVVANPSSYMYMTIVRPGETGTRFVNPDLKKCPKVNHYPFGLFELPAYAKRTGANAIREKYPSRDVVYLASEKIYADHILLHGCEADAQGATRLDRTKHFARYMTQSFGEVAEAHHLSALVAKAGYDPVSLYGSACGVRALFGDGRCSSKR